MAFPPWLSPALRRFCRTGGSPKPSSTSLPPCPQAKCPQKSASSSPRPCRMWRGSSIWATWWARCCPPTSSPASAAARGYETLAICATDEHGAPIELAALEEGVPVADYCAKWHQVQRDLGDKFGLWWDNFGRSSSPQNHELTLHFARALWKNGFLELRTTKQAYSATDRRFLPDRYVIGTCPHCGYPSWRAVTNAYRNCTAVRSCGSDRIRVRRCPAPPTSRSAIPRICFSNSRNFLASCATGSTPTPADTGLRSSLPSPTNGWTRACQRSRHHPRPGMGHPGAGRHRRRGAEGRTMSSMSGLMRRSNHIAAGLGEWAESPDNRQGRSPAKDWYAEQHDVTYWESARGQGQCAFPHGRASR